MVRIEIPFGDKKPYSENHEEERAKVVKHFSEKIPKQSDIRSEVVYE